MNDDREVTLLRAAQRPVRRQGRTRRRASPPGSRKRDADDGCALLACDARPTRSCSPPPTPGRRRASHRRRAARAPRARRAGSATTGRRDRRRARRQPGALPRAARRVRSDAQRRRADDARADATGRERPDAAAACSTEPLGPCAAARSRGVRVGERRTQAAIKLQPDATDEFLRAGRVPRQERQGRSLDWSDDTLAWKVRAALRADNGRPRWQQVVQAIDAMSAGRAARRGLGLLEGARRCRRWRAIRRTARAMRATQPRAAGRHRVGQLSFYGALAAENLGQPIYLPPRPAPLDRRRTRRRGRNPGCARALQLIAHRACAAKACANGTTRSAAWAIASCSPPRSSPATARSGTAASTPASARARDRHGAALPDAVPQRRGRARRARSASTRPIVYGLIRQESRFVMDARSGVGASGLMQIDAGDGALDGQEDRHTYTPAT